MARDDEDAEKKPKAYLVGQDVSQFSIADLDGQIARLKEEIGRLEATREGKRATHSAADALFRRP